jgi:septation ring formation regulator EzrA
MFAQNLSLLVILLTIIAGIFYNNKGLTELKADLKADMKDLKAELKGDIAGLRSELKGDIAGLESRMEKRLDRLESRLDTRLNAIQSEQLHFSELKGHLEGRIDEIAKLVAERVAA